jgi:hypothetical protein
MQAAAATTTSVVVPVISPPSLPSLPSPALMLVTGQATPPNRENVRKISAVDTIHDFHELSKNRFYQDFFASIKLEHTDINLDAYGDHNVEIHLMKDMHIDDDELVSVDFIDFSESNLQDNKPFVIKCDDINDDGFKQFFGLMISSAFPHNNPYMITDATILSQDYICDIKVKMTENGQKLEKQAAFVASEATFYDKGTHLTFSNCVLRRSIEAKLKKEDGNLFGLNKIKVFTRDNKTFVKYYYNYTDQNNTIRSDKQEIELENEFIINQKGMENRNLKFFRQIISTMFANKKIIGGKGSTGGAPGSKKRQRSDDTDSTSQTAKKQKITLDGLFELLYKVYKLDHNLFNFYNKGVIDAKKAEQFVRILFDFKRSADQLQSKSSKNSQTVFVSLDRVSICYAHELKLPCVKTSIIGKAVNGHRQTRKFTFYGFDKDTIISKVLNRDDYYIDVLNIYLNQFKQYIDSLRLIQQTLNLSDTEIQNIQQMMNNATNKSLNILDKEFTKYHIANEDRRSKKTEETFSFAKPIYLFRYLHKMNIVLNVIVVNLLRQIQSISAINAKLNEWITKFTDRPDIMNVKMILKMMTEDIDFNMFKMIELDSSTIMYFRNIISNYASSDNQILYDDSKLIFGNGDTLKSNDQFFAKYNNAIINMITNNSDNINVNILSEMIQFVLLYKQTISSQSKPYNIIMFDKETQSYILLHAPVDIHGKMTEDAESVKTVMDSYKNIIDRLYQIINPVAMVNEETLMSMYVYGGKIGISHAKPIRTPITINQKKQQIKSSKNSILPLSDDKIGDNVAITTFMTQLNNVFEDKDDISDMIKLLTLFFVKVFNLFDDDGHLTPLGSMFFATISNSPSLETSRSKSSHSSNQSKRASSYTSNNASKNASKNVSSYASNDASKNASKNVSNNASNNVSKNASKNASNDVSKNVSSYASNNASKNVSNKSNNSSNHASNRSKSPNSLVKKEKMISPAKTKATA